MGVVGVCGGYGGLWGLWGLEEGWGALWEWGAV